MERMLGSPSPEALLKEEPKLVETDSEWPQSAGPDTKVEYVP